MDSKYIKTRKPLVGCSEFEKKTNGYYMKLQETQGVMAVSISKHVIGPSKNTVGIIQQIAGNKQIQFSNSGFIINLEEDLKTDSFKR